MRNIALAPLFYCNNRKREVISIMKGTIKSLLSSYGFITPEGSKEDDKDLFFHKSGTSNFYELSVGDTVEYEEGEGKKGDVVAVDVEKIETEEDSEEE